MAVPANEMDPLEVETTVISHSGALSSFQAPVSEDQPEKGEAGKIAQTEEQSSVLAAQALAPTPARVPPGGARVRCCPQTQKPRDQTHAGLASVVLGTASEWKREDLHFAGLHAREMSLGRGS